MMDMRGEMPESSEIREELASRRFTDYEDAALYLEKKAEELGERSRKAMTARFSGLDETMMKISRAYSMTTIVAFETKDGAILAADSRATWSYTFRPAIGAHTKLTPLVRAASFGASGSASDGQFMSLLLEEDFEMHMNLNNRKLMSPRTMANRVNIYSTFFPWCTPIFAVYDRSRKKGRIFSYGGGSITEVESGYNGVGSGSEAIEALAGERAKAIRALGAREAQPLVEEIMVEAVRHDSFTGGAFRFHLLTERGVEQMLVSEDEWRVRYHLRSAADDMVAGKIPIKNLLRISGEIVNFGARIHAIVESLDSNEGSAPKDEKGGKEGDGSGQKPGKPD